MLTTWRITRDGMKARAFSGLGAFQFGGRWNPPGHSVVYTAESRTLAAMELLVHLDEDRFLDSYMLFRVDVPWSKVTRIDPAKLKDEWRATPPTPYSQSIGQQWLGSGISVGLRVPSVVVDGSYNYLLNPEHPDFAGLTVMGPYPFRYDPRLLKRPSSRPTPVPPGVRVGD